MTETEYLISTPTNAAHLAHSIEQYREGQAHVRELIGSNSPSSAIAADRGCVSATPPQSSNGAGFGVAE